MNYPHRSRGIVPGLVAVMLAFLASNPATAATQVSGIVAGQTWTTAGSPYEVTGDLLVASLTIRPGVRVEVLGGVSVEVVGTLAAEGTSDQMIEFRALESSARWRGIFFNEGPSGSVLEYCKISGSRDSGIRISNTIPILRHCRIEGNASSRYGGGINCSIKAGELVLEDCAIIGNRSGAKNLIGAAGGGVSVSGNTRISQCLIQSNICEGLRSSSSGQLSGALGGGVYSSTGRLIITNSVIRDNLCWSSGDVYLSRGGGVWVGGALRMGNCLLLNNEIYVVTMRDGPHWPYGGALSLEGASYDLVNCTIAGNLGSAVHSLSGTLRVESCIVWANGLVPFSGDLSRATVSYSAVQGGMAGNNNISSNPVLNPLTYELLQGSPCIDAGSPAAAYNDTCFPPSMGGVRNDMGAYGGPGACLGVGLGSDDSDGDGLPDAWEIEYFGNTTAQNSKGDADQDKVLNGDELKAGTDPTSMDTDGDGYSDFAEIRGKSNPLDPASIPPADLTLTVEQVRLEFAAGAKERVAIQSSADLEQWQDVEVITGTGEVITRIYNVSDGQRYFKTVRR